MKCFIHTLLIFAFVTLGVSPACAFTGGAKHWIEICAADGTLKRIKVDAAQSPFSDETQQEQEPLLSYYQDCAFCFSQAHLKALGAREQNVALPALLTGYVKLSSGISALHSLERTPAQARAPPASLL